MTEFEEGCPNCGYWQCTGCSESGYDERYEDQYGNLLEDEDQWFWFRDKIIKRRG